MHRQQISRSSSSDELSSRVLIHSAEQTTEHTLPISIIPSSSVTTTTTTRSTTYTQTREGIPIAIPPKSIPSFAETQLLSVYYPSQNPKNPSTNDKCIFVEQQDRQPIRYRTAYDRSAPSKSTQTLPLSTQGSTLIVDGNSGHEQYLKLHSGTQHLSNHFPDDSNSLSNELIEQSRYTYEEFIVNVQENPTRTSSSSSSSVTTVIAQNEELDSENNLSTNQRISGWPPVPDDLDNEQKRPSRVQFAEKLVHVIPVSTTNSLTETPVSPPAVLPRTNVNDPHHPINQSKWMKTHMDNSDIPSSPKPNRVNTLRSLFEQQSTHSTTLNNTIQTTESEEKPSKHGVEIRFRVNEPNIHHAEPAKVIPSSTNPFTLEQIQQITGKQLKNFDQIGRYLSDGHTWQWDEIFWLSLTTSQRDQLKDLEQRLLSRQNSFENSLSSSSSSTIEPTRFKSTISITGTGARQPNKPSSVLTKYTEVNTIDEIQPSISTFGSTPNARIDSEESISSSTNSTKRTDSQITIIESGYNSAEDQQKFRPNSAPIIEESVDHHPITSPKLDPLSYEQFLIDYLSTHAKHIRSSDGTLILLIDEQQIHMSNVRLSSSNENFLISKQIYLDGINREFSPFETESNQLVIFLADDIIILPTDRWLFYRTKYHQAKWIQQLKQINRNIPIQLIPIIEDWLSKHARLELNTREIHVDGVIIPLIGRLDQINNWNDVLNYLIRTGFVSYNSNEKLIQIANSELDAKRILNFPSKELIERLAKYLRLTNIDFHNENRTLIINEKFIISNEYVEILFRKYQQGEILNAEELAELLLQICQIEDDEKNNRLILTFNHQTLKLTDDNQIEFLTEWLEQLNEQKRIQMTEQNDIIISPHHEQQIIIKHEHVDEYMQNSKQTEVVCMNDIAHILILHDYIQYSNGQLIYKNEEKHENDQEINIEKERLIDFYVEFINNQGGIKYDNVRNLLLLENPSDGSELYLTEEHTQFIQENKYRRQDMKYLLNKYSELKQDEFKNWLLYYNNQCISLPSDEQVHISRSKSDPNLKLLFPFNKSLRLIQKTSSTTTLDIQQPNEENDYAIDPLLILANYIYRAGRIYQDEFGRLVIKLHRDEIVVPRHQAFNSILEINTSPNRTGTIIARLIARLGKVQSTKSGGLIITIGKDSLELSKEIIDQSKINLNLSNENLTSPILPSKSSDSLASSKSMDSTRKSRSQTSLSIKPRLLIIRDNQINGTTRFYVQYTYEEDRRSNSVMMLPSRYPVRPTQPRLIAPEHYRDITLRDASVHIRQEGENEVYYENLAQYLSANQTDLSSRIVRRMLKFSTRDEYFAYLHNQMSANQAEQLVQGSEELTQEIPTRFTNIRVRTPDREINEIEDNHRQSSRSPPGAFYNVKNGRPSKESFVYEHQFIERSVSSSSLDSDMVITKTYPSNRTIPVSQYV